MNSKKETIRELVVRKKLENSDLSHKAIAKDLNIAKSTVSLVLKNFDERLRKKSWKWTKKGIYLRKKGQGSAAYIPKKSRTVYQRCG